MIKNLNEIKKKDILPVGTLVKANPLIYGIENSGDIAIITGFSQSGGFALRWVTGSNKGKQGCAWRNQIIPIVEIPSLVKEEITKINVGDLVKLDEKYYSKRPVAGAFKKDSNIVKYLDKPGVFIHFGSNTKIKSKYTYGVITPKGYYGFALESREISKFLDTDYGRADNYVLFGVVGKILRVSQYDRARFEHDLKVLLGEKKFKKLYRKAEMEEEVGNFLANLDDAGKKHLFKKNIWFIKLIALIQAALEQLSIFEVDENKRGSIWSKILLKLGYSAIYDDVGYILSSDMPKEIVVLRNDAIKVIGRFDNPNSYY